MEPSKKIMIIGAGAGQVPLRRKKGAWKPLLFLPTDLIRASR